MEKTNKTQKYKKGKHSRGKFCLSVLNLRKKGEYSVPDAETGSLDVLGSALEKKFIPGRDWLGGNEGTGCSFTKLVTKLSTK